MLRMECAEWFRPDRCRCRDAAGSGTARDSYALPCAIPLAALGLDRTKLREGIRFNLLVNDNDGEARKGWIAAAPGIGSGKDAGKYPVVVGP